MTDASPLVKIKQALTRLRAETAQMDVRIGVVGIALIAFSYDADAYTRSNTCC